MRRINIKVVPRDEGSFVADQDWYIVRPPDGSDGEGSDSGDQRQWRSPQDPGNVEVAVNGNVWTFGGDMQPIVWTTTVAATTRLLNLNGSALMLRLSSDFFGHLFLGSMGVRVKAGSRWIQGYQASDGHGVRKAVGLDLTWTSVWKIWWRFVESRHWLYNCYPCLR